jgi:predicted DNA binding CopG/RHH family protein
LSKGRNTSTVTVRLPDELIEHIKKEAKKRGVGYTVLIRTYLELIIRRGMI